VALATALAVPGCSTTGSTGTKRQISELNLVAMPVPISLDSRPASDAIEVKIYAIDSELPKAQPIRQGNLDFLLYDGLMRGGVSEANPPLRTWSFPPAELAPRVFTTAVGTGYFFTLSWGKDHPKSNQITVIARYRPPQGAPVYSSACFISLPPPQTAAPGPIPAAPGAAPAVPGSPAPATSGAPPPVGPGR
jgi:hypothetical protein